MPKEPKTYAPRIPPSTWEEHRCRIKAMFVDENETLSKVAERMRKYGLDASESQYERQLRLWGIRKNSTTDEWRMIIRAVEERRRRGKDSVVFIQGIRQPNQKLIREIARVGYRKYGGLSQDLPDHILIVSSSTAASITGCARPGPRDSIFNMSIIAAVGRLMDALEDSIEVLRTCRIKTRGLDSRCSRVSETPCVKQPSISEAGYNALSNGKVCHRSSPSPEPWCIPSWESVGITSEEWVTRGWNVFFGAWG